MVEINKNFHNLEKSTTLAINEKSNELLSQGREVYKFGLGQSPFPVPESVTEELQKKAHEKDYFAGLCSCSKFRSRVVVTLPSRSAHLQIWCIPHAAQRVVIPFR